MSFKHTVLIIFFSIGAFAASAQTTITWNTLAEVDYSEKYYAEVDDYFYYPDFRPAVEQYAGKRVAIKGYLLPIDTEAGLYALSKNPMSSCFFCGGSGPESIAELIFEGDAPDFEMDDVATVSGILTLNADDIMHFNYQLHNAQLIKRHD